MNLHKALIRQHFLALSGQRRNLVAATIDIGSKNLDGVSLDNSANFFANQPDNLMLPVFNLTEFRAWARALSFGLNSLSDSKVYSIAATGIISKVAAQAQSLRELTRKNLS